MIYIVILAIILAFLTHHFVEKKKYRTFKSNKTFPKSWRKLLKANVKFYSSLSPALKIQFEIRILEFLANYKITPIKTKITELDKLLVASSAVIPTYRIENWIYNSLEEVLIYPSAFTTDFSFDNKKVGQKLVGMVGTGVMEGKMILSLKALRKGFHFSSDNKNVGIHEFVHLIDKEDGSLDGVPKILIENSFTIPWLQLIKIKTEEINSNNSDIDGYAATNKEEFFTVASEYFFENPILMKEKHPSLYLALSDAFRQDPGKWWKRKK